VGEHVFLCSRDVDGGLMSLRQGCVLAAPLSAPDVGALASRLVELTLTGPVVTPSTRVSVVWDRTNA
jgi:hypothetical protein